ASGFYSAHSSRVKKVYFHSVVKPPLLAKRRGEEAQHEIAFLIAIRGFMQLEALREKTFNIKTFEFRVRVQSGGTSNFVYERINTLGRKDKLRPHKQRC